MDSRRMTKILGWLFLVACVGAFACPKDPTSPPPLQLKASHLPDAEAAVPYAFQLQVDVALPAAPGSGCDLDPIRFYQDEVPVGLTVDGAGLIAGIPTHPLGDLSVVGVHYTGCYSSGNAELPINVVPHLVADLAILPQGPQGSAYSATATSHGGDGTPVWSVKSGTLPAGLTLSAGGVISGTPTANGTSTFTLLVKDALNVEDSLHESIVITPPAVGVNITTAGLNSGEVSVAYSATLTAQGGLTPYAWSIASGSLPAGLSLNSTSGVISGTPAASGPVTFVVKVTDATPATDTKSLTLTIAPAVTITTTSPLPTAVEGQPYSFSLAAANGIGSYTWSITSGPIGGGMSMTSGGVISGTPTVSSSLGFTVQVTDAAGGTATRAMLLPITGALIVTTALVNDGEVGIPYSSTLNAANGTPPYSWSVTSGALATTLSLSAGGVIAGTPTVAQTATFTATVTDNVPTSASKSFTQVIHPAIAITTTSPLPLGVDGQAYSTTLVATGGVGLYAWSITSGAPPAGLTLDAATGTISGTPTAGPGLGFTVMVADGIGGSASQAFTLPVNPVTVTIATTSPLPPAEVGLPYDVTLVATGGTLPYTWTSTSGTLPTNVGVIAGTLFSFGNVLLPTGTFTFDLQVKDHTLATNTKTFTLDVLLQPSWVTASLPDGHVGVPYSQQLVGKDGFPPLMFNVGSGVLPDGLNLSSSGALTGTPTTAQTLSFALRVHDSLGGFGYANFTMTIQP